MTEKERNLLYGVVSLILPENILDQFDIVRLEDEDIDRHDGTYQPFKHNVHVYLDEQDNRPTVAWMQLVSVLARSMVRTSTLEPSKSPAARCEPRAWATALASAPARMPPAASSRFPAVAWMRMPAAAAAPGAAPSVPIIHMVLVMSATTAGTDMIASMSARA